MQNGKRPGALYTVRDSLRPMSRLYIVSHERRLSDYYGPLTMSLRSVAAIFTAHSAVSTARSSFNGRMRLSVPQLDHDFDAE